MHVRAAVISSRLSSLSVYISDRIQLAAVGVSVSNQLIADAWHIALDARGVADA